MDEKFLEQIEGKFKTVVDQVMQEKLAGVVGPTVAAETRKIVEQMRAEKALFGMDRTGLTDEQKDVFAKNVKSLVFGAHTKAGEGIISEQDNRGGYLIPKEVADAIQRIAASVGLILSQAQKWSFGKGDEKSIPAYTGSFLEGEYLGVDAAGSLTGLTFTNANLIAKKWQLAFVVGNDVLEDASVDLANWLLALAGEALANMTDRQGFNGTGAPFIGVLNNADVTVITLPTGEDTFAEFTPDDASDMIGTVEESVLDGSAFYMHRTVWAKLRVKKDTAGNYILPQAGAPSSAILANSPTGGGLKPAGEILGFPVYTTRHLPANSASAVSTKYIVFGNMKALGYGDKGEMSIAQYASGNFSGEVALKDQTGFVYRHRHGLVLTLPAAFVVAKTAAS